MTRPSRPQTEPASIAGGDDGARDRLLRLGVADDAFDRLARLDHDRAVGAVVAAIEERRPFGAGFSTRFIRRVTTWTRRNAIDGPRMSRIASRSRPRPVRSEPAVTVGRRGADTAGSHPGSLALGREIVGLAAASRRPAA